MKKLVAPFILIALVTQFGCYRMAVKDPTVKEGELVENQWSPYVIDGLVPIGDRPIETDEKCPNGIAKVETEVGFLNIIVSMVTFGIYAPMTVRYWCAGGSAKATEAPVAPAHQRVADAAH